MGLATARAAALVGAEVTIASSRQDGSTQRLANCRTAVRARPWTSETRHRSPPGSGASRSSITWCSRPGTHSRRVRSPDLSLSDAHAILDVRFWGAVAVIKHAAPRITPGGSIGLTTGTVGQRPVPGAALAAAGAGSRRGPRPGTSGRTRPRPRQRCQGRRFSHAALGRHFRGPREALFARLAERTLTGTVGDPDQIAAAHIYLIENQYVTGTVQTVDGGLLLTGT